MKKGAKAAWWAVGIGAAALALRFAVRAHRRMDFAGSVVLITGGSRGLGLVLARRFAAEGARLALVARDAAELARAAGELSEAGADVFVVPCDITDRRAAEGAVEQVLAHYGHIDVLVNDAGIITVGPLDTMTLEDFERSLDVHARAPLYLSRAVIGPMRRQGGGRIVNVVSIGGKVAIPHLAPYTMGKFALAGLSDALRGELARDGIRVTTVFPGLMRTGSHVRAEFKGNRGREYGWFAVSNASPLASTSADAAARRILEACRFGDAQLILTPQAKLLALAQALAPGLTAGALALVARALPRAPAGDDTEAGLGWEQRGGAVQRWLTRRSDAAIDLNNEQPGATAQ